MRTVPVRRGHCEQHSTMQNGVGVDEEYAAVAETCIAGASVKDCSFN